MEFISLLETSITPNQGMKVNMFLTCTDLINEGSTDILILSESANSIKSMALEMLDRIKKFIMDMYDQILILLDRYLINVAATSKRYREILLKIPNEKVELIEYMDYTYPKFDDLPVFEIPKSYEFPDSPDKISTPELRLKIDKMIHSESAKILNKDFREVLQSNYKDKFKEMCLKEFEGEPKLARLNKEKLEKLIDESLYVGDSDPKAFRDKLKNDRETIIKTYEDFRRVIDKDLEIHADRISNKVTMKFKDVEMDIDGQQLQRINNNVIEVNRFYITMINLYDTAYTTKLQVHKNRIIRYQELLTKVINQSSASHAAIREVQVDIHKKFVIRNM